MILHRMNINNQILLKISILNIFNSKTFLIFFFLTRRVIQELLFTLFDSF